MQNWDSSLQPANYDNNWYGNIFPQIKSEPHTTNNSNDGLSPTSPPLSSSSSSAHQQQQQPLPISSVMDHYLNIKNQHLQQQQQQQQGLNMSTSLTPSPRTDSNEGPQQFFDNNNNNNGNNINTNNLLHQQLHNQHPLGFNPLTPPGLPNAILPQINFHNHDFTLESNQQHQQIKQTSSSSHLGQSNNQQNDTITKLDNNNSLTPRNTPPMDITPPKSPKNLPTIMYNNSNIINNNNNNNNNEYLHIDKDQEIISNSSDLIDSDDDDEGGGTVIRMPIYNSHGKMKNYKCKSCGYLAVTKIAFWQHTRSHMKPEKLLQCSKCPFVTELKHHLEYHIRKHKNLKPFQCNKCNYTCVNKSMLNSHLKSHSSVYQYRCTDCDYATKYCHSFKLHLRKYDHKPGLVLDEEGLPNPSIIIDVYGTRRGPKMKSGGVGRVSKKESKLAARLAMNQQHHQKQQLQQQQHQQQQQHVLSPIKSDIQALVKNEQQQQQSNIQNFLPNPLANMLQQQHNMSQFFPYWNLNLQMLAAQQQAVLAQLSPQMREAAIQQSLNCNTTTPATNTTNNDKEFKKYNIKSDNALNHDDDDDDEDNYDDLEEDRRSETSSAMDLSSQGTPTKLNPLLQNEHNIINMKINDDITTPTISSSSSLRRKGRVLKLDTLLTNNKESSISDDSYIKLTDEMDCTTTGTDKSSNDNEAPTSSSTSATILRIDNNNKEQYKKDQQLVDTTKTESIDSNTNGSIPINGIIESTTTTQKNSTSLSGIFECKYCDIYFKDAVLYTIHMGYHSCDDVFKCNMCGEKCDGPVGLFVHMARNAHS